jgi:hypothetical protein
VRDGELNLKRAMIEQENAEEAENEEVAQEGGLHIPGEIPHTHASVII